MLSRSGAPNCSPALLGGLRGWGAALVIHSLSSFPAGTEDQCAVDTVLWHPQRLRARVQLDPGAARPGGLWDRRGPPVVSKHSALAV
jgi:hypothetical protein